MAINRTVTISTEFKVPLPTMWVDLVTCSAGEREIFHPFADRSSRGLGPNLDFQFVSAILGESVVSVGKIGTHVLHIHALPSPSPLSSRVIYYQLNSAPSSPISRSQKTYSYM